MDSPCTGSILCPSSQLPPRSSAPCTCFPYRALVKICDYPLSSLNVRSSERGPASPILFLSHCLPHIRCLLHVCRRWEDTSIDRYNPVFRELTHVSGHHSDWAITVECQPFAHYSVPTGCLLRARRCCSAGAALVSALFCDVDILVQSETSIHKHMENFSKVPSVSFLNPL